MAANSDFAEALGQIVSNKATLVIMRPGSKFSNKSAAKTKLGKYADKIGSTVTGWVDNFSLLDSVKSYFGINTEGLEDGVIEVQYNPASIKYSGSISDNSKSQKTETGSTEDRTLTNVSPASNIDMSFTLVFHSRFTTDQSVREQMELVIGMLYSSPIKDVVFCWSNMMAYGTVTSFNGKYDMFDLSGNPISGKMDITMKLLPNKRTRSISLSQIGQTRNDKVSGD
jgi:hypothetical protein